MNQRFQKLCIKPDPSFLNEITEIGQNNILTLVPKPIDLPLIFLLKHIQPLNFLFLLEQESIFLKSKPYLDDILTS